MPGSTPSSDQHHDLTLGGEAPAAPETRSERAVVSPGVPDPLGSRYHPATDAWNFAVPSRYATRVELRLYDTSSPDAPCLVVDLARPAHRTGVVWHACVPRSLAPTATHYAYRVDGPPRNAAHDHRFDAGKLLLDPFARGLWFPPGFDRARAIGAGDNEGAAPLSVLPAAHDRTPESDTCLFPFASRPWKTDDRAVVLYELHVKGFTRDASSGVDPSIAGTFAGLIEKIPYLVDLGVTTVELMPITQFDPQEGNYWGYMPLSFFAVHQEYAGTTDAHAAAEAFRALVDAMHAAGLEVILDLVQNHTAEAHPDKGPTYSLRGLDHASFFHPAPGPGGHPPADYTGVGNTLNGSDPSVVRLITAAQRHWAERFGVDGFRHDLYAALMRAPDGSIMFSPPLLAAIRSCRTLHALRHTGEPWDAARGGFLLGSAFPDERMWQWNARYRDDARRFVRGDDGLVGAVMRRLYGSDGLFPSDGPVSFRPPQSVNYITSHDGFTLYDLVSYTAKRNHANGHDNTDGPPSEISFNCGHEGDDGEVPPEVMALRVRQAKNLLTLLLLSNGTPLIRSGDEFLNTQGGNSNPYNQDNETGWLDWSRLEQFKDFHAFVRDLIHFRQQHGSIGRDAYWEKDIDWHGAGGPVSFDNETHHFAYHLRPERAGQDELYVMLNMEPRPVDFVPVNTGHWSIAIETSRERPHDLPERDARPVLPERGMTVAERSIVVLTRPYAGPTDQKADQKPTPPASP